MENNGNKNNVASSVYQALKFINDNEQVLLPEQVVKEGSAFKRLVLLGYIKISLIDGKSYASITNDGLGILNFEHT